MLHHLYAYIVSGKYEFCHLFPDRIYTIFWLAALKPKGL